MAAAVLGSAISGNVGLRLLMLPLDSNIVIRTACCSVGIVLPVYSTFKAIERKDQHEQRRWLLYWAAYGSFSIVEIFSDKILSWFPMYYYMKFAFLVWLQFPSGEGSRHLYRRHLRPFLLRHQARLDQVVGFTSNELEPELFLWSYDETIWTPNYWGRFVSEHQEEIQYAKSLLQKITMAVNQTLKDMRHPGQARGPAANAIEGPTEERG